VPEKAWDYTIVPRQKFSFDMGSIIDRHVGKSGLKRDGPVFFLLSPVKVAGDERTIMAIVVPRFPQLGPASRWSGRANLPVCPN
jgi:hypothetical protein